MLAMLLCVITGSCSPPSWVEPYTLPFKQEMLSYGIVDDITGYVAYDRDELPINTYSQCNNDYRHPKITVNSLHWGKLSDSQKVIVITHELGHCILHLEHGKGVMKTYPLEANNETI